MAGAIAGEELHYTGHLVDAVVVAEAEAEVVEMSTELGVFVGLEQCYMYWKTDQAAEVALIRSVHMNLGMDCSRRCNAVVALRLAGNQEVSKWLRKQV